MKKAVVLLSGGLDSTVLAAYLLDADVDVIALSVHYGQRHARELGAAEHVATALKLPQVTIDATALAILLSGSALTSPETIAMPHGHYADESMKATVVPNRNMLLLAMAGALAVSSGADAVAYAAHAGDHPIYPDCRPEFMDAMRGAFRLAAWKPLHLETPFAHKSKADLVTLGHQLDAPFALTYSCYQGQPRHCGLCGTCVERREAFELAGVPDPTEYA